MAKETEIKLNVNLDDANHPKQIFWTASDDPNGANARECKAVLISLFDKEHKDTYKIDLWTSEMQVAEMDRMVYQTLKTLAGTYFTATKNTELANAMHQFADYFGEKTELVSPS